MDIVVFGTGRLYSRYRNAFERHSIVAFLDNDVHKHGQYLDGKPVMAAEAVSSLKYQRIYIMSNKYFDVLFEQLHTLGVPEKVIFSVSDLWELRLDANEVSSSSLAPESAKRKILVVSNGFSFTGAPIAAFYAAAVLSACGYDVTALSDVAGPLQQEYVGAGIKTLVDVDLGLKQLDDIQDVDVYDVVIVNTMTFYYLLRRHGRCHRIIWWIHEAQEFYADISRTMATSVDFTGVEVYAVSNIARKNFLMVWPGKNIGCLRYGIPDKFKSKSKGRQHDKIIFAVVGTISERKGSDLLLDAFRGMSSDFDESYELWIVGNADKKNVSPWERKIIRGFMQIPQVNLLGILGREEMTSFYEEIDVLICSSREDPLPIVITESMMHYKPVIMPASGIGQVELLDNQQGDLLFESDSAKDLTKKIEWSMSHLKALTDNGKVGRKIYEKYFTMEVFKQQLMSVMECED